MRGAPQSGFSTLIRRIQCAQVRPDLRSPSQWTRFPTPVATKARPMPTHERLGTDNREDLQDRRKPAIPLDKEPAIGVCEPDPALHLAPQNDQLMSKCCIFSFKSAPRLERPAKTARTKHSSAIMVLTLGDSFG